MKLTVNTFLSLDGVMQGPGGRDEDTSGGFDRGGWLVPHIDEDFGRIVNGWFANAEAILLGRTTYQMMQPYWEQVTDPEDPVAAAMNNLPKYLVSSTVAEPTWQNTTLLSGDPVQAVAELKSRPGAELQVHGSHRLARALHDAGLVDEYRLLIFPVVVGKGKRLFDDGAVPSAFELVDSATTGAGAVSLTLLPRPFSTGDFGVEDGRETTIG
ncbi:dihydrofolate reductase family protein [Arthrobacter mobilis]|uniref:Dihydrofolate reductase family protein n=1 Tax=Arthrobacter mobilis TaxID=2724944 RepID=A0A7X6HES3_9MICC|nr:dihydrofolate reductase family protein [Arthrobacter mobilis]NKX54347.1 dihydrofolate reductase family protein [Arthrobacter mobilis]